MNRLHIIAMDQAYGDSIGFLKLGLSPGTFRTISTLKEASELVSGPVYMVADMVPLQSTEIKNILRSKGGINLGNISELQSFIDLIYNDIQEVINLYSPYRTPESNFGVINKLEEKLKYRRLTASYGFEYKISRNHLTGNMNIHPESERMEVIYNLLNARALQIRASMDKVESIKIGKPLR